MCFVYSPLITFFSVDIIPVRSTPEACANLPDNVSEVDVIVSDWIGVGFFRSNLLLQVITARDKFMVCSVHTSLV